MSLATCIVDPEVLSGSSVELTGEAYHHLFRVRRLGPDDQVRLVDGRGGARWGRIERVTGREAIVRLGEPAPTGEAELWLEIWAAAPRPQRAAWLVEKGTEVGVSAVRWIDTERSGRETTAVRLDRLGRVAAAAVEQCHRARVPEIAGLTWNEAVARLEDRADGSTVWFLDAVAEEGLGSGSAQTPEAVLLIGPEGGWTDRERAELRAAGARAASLGPRVLRVETAAVVGAALMLCRQSPVKSG